MVVRLLLYTLLQALHIHPGVIPELTNRRLVSSHFLHLAISHAFMVGLGRNERDFPVWCRGLTYRRPPTQFSFAQTIRSYCRCIRLAAADRVLVLPTVAQHRAEKTRKGRATSPSRLEQRDDGRECHTPGRHAMAGSGVLVGQGVGPKYCHGSLGQGIATEQRRQSRHTH